MDGCVNSRNQIQNWFSNELLKYDEFDSQAQKIFVRKKFAEEFCNSKELIFPFHAKFVTKIVNETDCKIVWSSTWRKLDCYKNIEETKEMFKRRCLPYQALIDYTPICRSGFRQDEIENWLSSSKETIEKFAVLDDIEISIKKENGKFFKTNDDFGLTEEITNEIINWFVSVC